jgi:UV excision repair protein RAD23
MKLTFKTLQQQQFAIEAEASDKVVDVKQKIEQQESHPAQAQKLILKGKILADDVLVGDLEVTEKDFIVLMVTKPKVSSTATTPVQPTPVQSAPAPAPVPAAAPTPVAAPVAAPFDPSTLATGNEFNTAVENMVEMGFPRDQVMAAMKAAFNNPDRAAEYLMTGIPEGLQGQTPAPPSAPQPSTTPTAQATAQAPGEFVNLFQQAQQQQAQRPAPGAETINNPDLAALRSSPQFQNLRRLVQQQPHVLPALLQQIEQTNPQLMQVYFVNFGYCAKSR